MSENKRVIPELNVEALNIVDKDGKVKMKLFNQDNIPPLIMNGKDILPGHRQSDPISGMMFYNGKGEECGGLIYGSEEDEEGNYYSGGSLTFDQYNQDQVVQMYYEEENGEKSYGINIFDRPETPMYEIMEKQNEIANSSSGEEEKNAELRKLWEGNTHRAFMGKGPDGEIQLKLMDSKGKPRIRMAVDKDDNPILEFLGPNGDVIYKLPPEE